MNMLSIFVNQDLVFEFDRDTALDEQKLAFLDKMDADMERGIKIKGELIASPADEQRARFVAMNLLKALQQQNDAAIAVSCTYLIHRQPGLLAVHFNDHENAVAIDFKFENDVLQ